jgi:hypothetical protein
MKMTEKVISMGTFLLIALVLPLICSAQDRKTDDTAIRKSVEEYVAIWNSGDVAHLNDLLWVPKFRQLSTGKSQSGQDLKAAILAFRNHPDKPQLSSTGSVPEPVEK